ncbi:MAG: diguanylate cyclase [Anaerolineae bacterium]|jgi:diguanylate cyclase (GGDEF)-like protein|nr:diguanylate cyclase [Anaerolineae bacterium]
MTPVQQSIYLFTMIAALFILAFLLIRAWRNYLYRGARSFLLMIFTLIGFHSFFLVSNFAANAEDRQMIMSAAFLFLSLFPLTWIIMVREIAELDRSKSGRVLVPLLILNMAITTVITYVPGVYEFSGCFSRGGTLVFCTTERSFVWLGLIGILVIEIIWGAAFLLNHYRKHPNARERSQALALIVGVVGIPILTIFFLAIFQSAYISPMPFAVFAGALLLYNAVFNYKILGLRFSENQMIPMVDDLMLMVNEENIVQDFNLSTLTVFNTQVRNLVNVHLEHAFVDYPQIIELFNKERVTGVVELLVDGVTHTFEPNMVVVMDQETGREIGKRLQLRDVTAEISDTHAVNIVRDAATGLYNQEAFYSVGEHIFQYSRENHHRLAVIMMRIDYLRRYEEKYTHAVVDVLLKQMVDIIDPLLSPTDLLARFTDDTLVFLLDFPEESNSTALELCHRMQRRLADHFFEHQEQRIQLTVSQGYTVDDGDDRCDLERLVHVSQSALKKLQAEGSNGIEFISQTEVSF